LELSIIVGYFTPAAIFSIPVSDMSKHPVLQPELLVVGETGSTNNYATTLLNGGTVKEGTVVLTFRQTAGRGNGQTVWESEDNRNLTFSIILFPGFLAAGEQFLLSKAVSLGVASFLASKTGGVAIKWPNDVFINGKKAAGILIENRIAGDRLQASVIGIGLNLNQQEFPAHLPHATSLAAATGRFYPPRDSLNELLGILFSCYQELREGKRRKTGKLYLQHLYRYGEPAGFRSGNRTFRAVIRGVDRFGRLLLEETPGKTDAYGFKEVEMVL